MTMRRAVPIRPSRRGISLTEILIAIMILGVGLVSLATLFPIGLLRIREAQRYSRTAFLTESAGADLASRGLLNRGRFLSPVFCPWYSELSYPSPSGGYDPWIQDTPGPGLDWMGYGNIANAGAYRGAGGRGPKTLPNQLVDVTGTQTRLTAVTGAGLPVAYDPLWWYQQGLVPSPSTGVEWRFGDGGGLGLSDGSGGDSAGIPSISGLQRVTDRNPTYVYDAGMILSTFISPEDVLWQEVDGVYQDYDDPTTPVGPLTTPSPVLPDLTTSYATAGSTGLTNDWRYSCMFVGQQADGYNGKVLNGDVGIFENRPPGFEQGNNTITGTSITQAAGERVVQAVFGVGTNLYQAGTMPFDGNNTPVGFPLGSNNAVLLLWPMGTPDLEIKTGSWIADVTYERRQAVAVSRFQYVPLPGSPPPPPAQRCYWYQVKRVTPPADTAGTVYGTLFGAARYALVYTSTPLRAKTLWNTSTTAPYHVNAALVSPFVVGVAPRSFVLP